jgi:hypothetical protein
MHGKAVGIARVSGLAMALLALLAPSRAARAAPDSSQCRIECAAPFADRAQNTVVIQTCLVRCAARAAALGSANVTIATVMPTPQTPWTHGPDIRRPTIQPVDIPREMGRQAQRMAKREKALIRRQAATRGQQAVASANPAPEPAAPSFFGSLMAAQAAPPGAAAMPAGTTPDRSSYGAIYLAAAPSRGYGLVVGAGDRGAAHRIAEGACLGGAANTCRIAGDFTARCAAVAHGLRSNRAVVMTAHPSTYTVIAATSGTGASRADAERQALSACAQRGRGLSCQVTEARCAE